MIIDSSIRWSNIDDMVPGSIGKSKLESGSPFLVIDKTEKSTVIAMLAGEEQFRWHEIKSGLDVLSFGIDWVLKPILKADEYPGRRTDSDSKSPLILSQLGYGFIFRPGGGNYSFADDLHFSFENSRVAKMPDRWLHVGSWQIWESRDHLVSGEGVAIVSCLDESATQAR